ncbi:speckle-type POZ protein B [Caerostris darwini]|uniref:Speckle-type POZ protein B n=1 Tax=Caerostris darwini TaxID=1538125 RepID=A0AAV4VR12_9ARAC|nr:speckle-type POZ protein B [Caerostris darwini]
MACENITGKGTFTVTWIIDNFEYCIEKEGEYIKSPTFVAPTFANTKWSLRIYPRKGNDISLCLFRESDSKGPLKIKINYEFALLAADGLCRLFDTTEECFSTNSISNLISVDQDYLSTNFLSNGNLVVRCKMWYSKKEISSYCRVRTHIGVEKKILIWSIKKFSTLEKGIEPTLKIKSTRNQKLIASLKLSLTEDDDETLQMSFIYPNSQVRSMYFSNKLYILDSNNVAVPWSNAGVFFDDFSKESKFSLAITKGEIMEKKSQYLRADVLSLLCECDFSTGETTGELEGCDPDAEIQGMNPIHWTCLQSCRSHRKNENCYKCEH